MALQQTLERWNGDARIQELMEYGGRRNKQPPNTVTNKLIINKHENNCVGVCYGIFPTENCQEAIINCFVLCFV